MSFIILVISIVFYGLASIFAIRLIRSTGQALPWVLISGALTLLAGQCAMPLLEEFPTLSTAFPSLMQAFVSLVISLLLMTGVALVAPLLRVYSRNAQLREVLHDRQMIVEQQHEDQLRSLKQVQVALEIGKPVSTIIGQVNALTLTIQEFLENMKSGLIVGKDFSIALQALIEEMSQVKSLPIQIDIDPGAAARLTKDQSIQLMHITREAVRNSQQHAEAKKGRVRLKGGHDVVALDIFDNGHGFEVDLVKAQGNGLGNMVARARKIGARLKINSDMKQGTHVYVEVPIEPVAVEHTSASY